MVALIFSSAAIGNDKCTQQLERYLEMLAEDSALEDYSPEEDETTISLISNILELRQEKTDCQVVELIPRLKNFIETKTKSSRNTISCYE